MPNKEMESIAEGEQSKETITSGKLKQKSYYVTEEQHRKLKMRVAMGIDKDISAAVRAAIDLYLAEKEKDYE